MHTLLSEYEALKALAQTQEGWKSINEAWMRASNYVQGWGGWQKRNVSSGENVLGFALDPVTKRYLIGKKGDVHKQPYFDLVNSIQHAVSGTPEFFEIEDRLLEGRLATIEGWKHPFATLIDAISLNRENPHALLEAENLILELGIGLPLSKLTLDREVRRLIA